MLRKQFPAAVPVMEAARDVVLAFLHFPQEHCRKVWSTTFNRQKLLRSIAVLLVWPFPGGPKS
jgi:transposase-like protein